MTQNEFFTIRTFSNLLDAEVAVEHLKSHRIEASIKKDDAGGTRPHLQLTFGVDVVIFKKDAKRAEEILTAMKV